MGILTCTYFAVLGEQAKKGENMGNKKNSWIRTFGLFVLAGILLIPVFLMIYDTINPQREELMIVETVGLWIFAYPLAIVIFVKLTKPWALGNK